MGVRRAARTVIRDRDRNHHEPHEQHGPQPVPQPRGGLHAGLGVSASPGDREHAGREDGFQRDADQRAVAMPGPRKPTDGLAPRIPAMTRATSSPAATTRPRRGAGARVRRRPER